MSSFQIKGHPFTGKLIDSGLYIVSTPIGNLGDMTIRALETLAGCDVIACEDTRVTAKLLRHFNISTKMIAYHEHNADHAGPKLIEQLNAGKSVALASDAGTPLVSDPGFRLVEQAHNHDIKVYPLPGASAPLAALVASGLSAEAFTFAGFLPTKQGARQAKLQAYENASATVMFFESPNRIAKSLSDMVTIFGASRQAVVARELTKLHEEFARGTLGELQTEFETRSVKGEIVVLISPHCEETVQDIDQLLKELLIRMSVSKAAAEAVELTGLSKRDLYQRALALKDKD